MTFVGWIGVATAAPAAPSPNGYPALQDIRDELARVGPSIPGWTERMNTLATEWGDQLFTATSLIRFGKADVYRAKGPRMIVTLGEMNLRLQAIPKRADAERAADLAITRVAQLVRAKLGLLGYDEASLLTNFAWSLSTDLNSTPAVRAAGLVAVNDQLKRYGTTRRVRGGTLIAAPTILAATCAALFWLPASNEWLRGLQYGLGGVGISADVAGFIAALRAGRTAPARPLVDDVNFVTAPVLGLREIFNAPVPAATPSVVFRAE